jgi:hypothetical protein
LGRSRQDCSTSRRKVWRGALADTMAGRSQQPGLPHRPCQSIQGCCEVWPSIGQLHEIECDGEKKRPGNRSPTPLTGVGRASYFGGFHGGFKTFETFDASSTILLARTWGPANGEIARKGAFLRFGGWQWQNVSRSNHAHNSRRVDAPTVQQSKGR